MNLDLKLANCIKKLTNEQKLEVYDFIYQITKPTNAEKDPHEGWSIRQFNQ